MVSTFRTKEILAPDIDLAPAKILVVDDYPANRITAMALLALEGYEVFEAESGAIALEKVIKIQPDLILLDVMMPEMDGYETMRAIRQIDQFQSLPIIALTAKAMKGDREKCIEAGASDYITKPVDTEQLLSLLRVWVYR